MGLRDLFHRKSKTTPGKPAPVATQTEPAPVPSPRPPFAVRSFGLSDRGQVRPSNEDRFAIVELARTLHVHQTNLPKSTAQIQQSPGTRLPGRRRDGRT